MLLTDIRATDFRLKRRLSARFRPDQKPADSFELWFEFPAELAESLDASADAFMPVALLLAMRKREPLMIEGKVSTQLIRNCHRASATLNRWWPELHPIDIRPLESRDAIPLPGRSVGSFFSLGVDSWYTLLKNQSLSAKAERITHLILVHGFDIPLENSDRFQLTLKNAMRAASARNCALIPVRTNIKQRLGSLSWFVMHGPAMGAVALALSNALKRIHIPSTDEDGFLVPRGSHPDLDPLWSTEATEIVHDGTEASKHRKIGFIAGSDLVLETLRVCSSEPDEILYNCSRCLKCQGTMISLRTIGALDRARTFDGRIHPKRLERLLIPPPDIAFWEDRLRASLDPQDRMIADAIRNLLDRSRQLPSSRGRFAASLSAWTRKRAWNRPNSA